MSPQETRICLAVIMKTFIMEGVTPWPKDSASLVARMMLCTAPAGQPHKRVDKGSHSPKFLFAVATAWWRRPDGMADLEQRQDVQK